MAKSITVKTSDAISSNVTAPRLIIEIAWSSVVRICTRETVTWSGHIWRGDIGRVSDIGGSNADQRCTIAIDNADNAIGAIALTEGLSDIPVVIRALYGDAPYSADDAVLLFDGALDGGVITLDQVVIDCIAMRGAAMYAPRIHAMPPVVNHATTAGTVLRWGADSYMLERSR